MTIGEKIAAARKKAEMSQQELADRLEIKGAGISQWETDKRTPKVKNLIKIADALGIGLAELLAVPTEDEKSVMIGERNLSIAENQLRSAIQNGESEKEIASLQSIVDAAENALNEFIIPVKLEHQRDLAQKRVEAMQAAQKQKMLQKQLSQMEDERKLPPEQQKIRGLLQSIIHEIIGSAEDEESLVELISTYAKMNGEGRLELIKRAKEMVYVPSYYN